MTPARLLEWIAAEKKKLLNDERFHYPPANVIVNAPLALEQVSMKARMRALDEVELRLVRPRPRNGTRVPEAEKMLSKFIPLKRRRAK